MIKLIVLHWLPVMSCIQYKVLLLVARTQQFELGKSEVESEMS